MENKDTREINLNSPTSVIEGNPSLNIKKNKKILLVILGVFLLFVIVISGLYFYNNNENQIASPLSQEAQSNVISQPIEDTPFSDMTIPYLRIREYESNLAELSQISSNSNYASYLTSYDSDGFRVNGLLTKPAGDIPESGFPAIIFVHGYIPPTNYSTTTSYSAYVDYLARNGFAVFKIDLRGHAQSEGEAHGAYYSSDYIVDVLNARSAISKLDFINSGKIGFWGHSMAGNVVFRSFVAAQNVPAVVIWAGAVYTYDDWQEFGLSDNSYRPPALSSERQRRREELFNTHGEFDSSNSFWKMVVPTNYLDGMKGAIQLNHAVDDNVVNVGYSRGLSNILESTDIKHELNEYQGGGHNISESSFNQAMQDTVRFFRENL